MKNKLVLLMGAFGAMLILIVVFLCLNLSTINLSIPKPGEVVSDGKVVIVDDGSKVVQNTPVNLLVDHETISNDAFYVSDDSETIIPLKDVFYVNEECEIGYIKKNSVIKNTGSEYLIEDTKVSNKELILYNPEDDVMAVLSPSIEYDSNTYQDVVIIETTDSGAMTLHDFNGSASDQSKNYILDDKKVKTQYAEYDIKQSNYQNSSGETVNTKNTTTNDITKSAGEKNDINNDNSSSNNNNDNNSDETTTNSSAGKATESSPAGVASPTSGLSHALDAFFSQLNESIPKIYSSNKVGWDYVDFDVVLSDPDGTLLSADLIVTEEGASSPVSVTSLQFVDGQCSVRIGNLKPETKYNYRIEMTYYPKGEETRAIVESSYFKTYDYAIGIEFQEVKSDSVKINLTSNSQIKYKSGKVIIDDRQGNKVEQEIDFEQASKPEGQTIEFTGLDSNRSYLVYFKELKVGDKYVTISDEVTFKTKKKTPKVQAPIVTVDYLNSSFNVTIPPLDDPDFLVDSVDYVIYNATDTVNPVKVYTSKYHPTNNTYSFKEDSTILRNRNYRFQIVVRGYDNISYQEVKSDITSSYSLIGLHPPEAELNVTTISATSLEGTVKVTDLDRTMNGNAKLVLKEGQTVVETKEITSLGTIEPFVFSGLKPLTNYTLEVQASFDLANGQPMYTNYPIVIKIASTTLVRSK